MFIRWLPMYWPYLNFNVWVIWASDIFCLSIIGWRVYDLFVRWLTISLRMENFVGQLPFRSCHDLLL
jgi:hypothetical protein